MVKMVNGFIGCRPNVGFEEEILVNRRWAEVGQDTGLWGGVSFTVGWVNMVLMQVFQIILKSCDHTPKLEDRRGW